MPWHRREAEHVPRAKEETFAQLKRACGVSLREECRDHSGTEFPASGASSVRSRPCGKRADRIIILTEHIWPIAHGFVSGRAATGGARLNLEARALAAVSGVKEDRSAARISLSAADAGHRRHIIALGLIALLRRPWSAV